MERVIDNQSQRCDPEGEVRRAEKGKKGVKRDMVTNAGKWQAGREGERAGNLSVDTSEKADRGSILHQQQFPVFPYL